MVMMWVWGDAGCDPGATIPGGVAEPIGMLSQPGAMVSGWSGRCTCQAGGPREPTNGGSSPRLPAFVQAARVVCTAPHRLK